jgi:putative tricarboxylic transport membrane protein
VRIDDTIWGAALVALGGTVFVHVQRFPSIPGQSVGPGAFPGVLGVALALCGVLLLVRGLRARWAAGAGGGARPPWVEWPDWFGAPRQRLGFVVLVAVCLFYLLAAGRLGFIPCGTVFLTALMVVLQVRPGRALLLGVVMTLLIHHVFYKLLKVPLPWGLLESIAW